MIRERVGPALTSPCRGWLWNSWTLSYVNMPPKCCVDLTTDSCIHFALKFCLYAHSRRECLSPSVRPPGRSSKPLLRIFCLISLGRGGKATGTTTVSGGGIRSPGEVIRWAIKEQNSGAGGRKTRQLGNEVRNTEGKGKVIRSLHMYVKILF